MSDSVERISVKEKVGYGLGDMAANFVFQALMALQMFFYTETFGISAAATGTLIMVVTLASLFFDPIMGVIADRTTTKYGKFRPWIAWTAIPFGILALAAFTTPNMSTSAKLVYAYITYILLMAVYSANNVPYSALSGVMTGDMAERTSISSYRQVFANGSAFIVQSLAIPMRDYFGGGDNAKGYQITFGLLAVAAVLCFAGTVMWTKERIQPAAGQKSSLGQDIKDLFNNGPWIVLFIVTVMLFIGLCMRNATMQYYFKYCVGNEKLFAWFNGYGLASLIIGVTCSTMLANRMGKRTLFIVGLSIAAVLSGLMIVLPVKNVVPVFVVEVIRQFAWGLTAPLLWAMMADVADYSEWKTGRRATAMVFAATVFGLKAGLGVGRSFAAWILSAYGYVAPPPNTTIVQSSSAMTGIQMVVSVYTAIAFFVAVFFLFLYKIDEKMQTQMSNELADRRKKLATS